MNHVFNIANSKNMTDYLTKVFGDIDLGIQESINATIDKIGKECSKKVRSLSPKDRGKYAKGWRYRAKKLQSDGSFSAVVYNAKYGWLTHLVEFDRPLVINGEKVKTIKGQPHVAPTNEWLQTEGVKMLKTAIQNEVKNLKT